MTDTPGTPRPSAAASAEAGSTPDEGSTRSDYAKALGARLRAIRTQQGLSLQRVEQRSHGAWKAVVVGSYERGDRAVTVARLAELADFYGVPIAELLPGAAPAVELSGATAPDRIVIDLERLAKVPAERAGSLSRYVSTIQRRRGDYNGRVLTLRRSDLDTLALIYDTGVDELVATFVTWGVLGASRNG
jgi:transcriptional regulator with XRE-family HTH domain